MKSVRIPGEVLATEIRRGQVAIGTVAGYAATGRLGPVVSAIAERGLKKAGEVGRQAAGLQFPPHCCNCFANGNRVRPIETISIVARGVAYTFKFRIPHCANCSDTASRKRPGAMGMLAASLVVALPVIIAMLAVGAATNRNIVMAASFFVGPAVGFAVPYLWTRMRKPRPGQASWYQAVYASAIDVDFSGVPKAFTLTF